VTVRERKGSDGAVSFQLVVYAGRDGQGRDQYVRRTHAQLLIDVQHGRTTPSRSLTVSELAKQ
jgi:hypothetical protein